MDTLNVAAADYATTAVAWDQPASDLAAAQAGPYFVSFDGGAERQIGPIVANLSSPFTCTIAVSEVVGSPEPPAQGGHSFTVRVPGRTPVVVGLTLTGCGVPTNFRTVAL